MLGTVMSVRIHFLTLFLTGHHILNTVSSFGEVSTFGAHLPSVRSENSSFQPLLQFRLWLSSQMYVGQTWIWTRAVSRGLCAALLSASMDSSHSEALGVIVWVGYLRDSASVIVSVRFWHLGFGDRDSCSSVLIRPLLQLCFGCFPRTLALSFFL